MKTVFNTLLAISFTLVANDTKAQAGYDDEPLTAENLIEMQDGVSRNFIISPIRVANTANGFAIQWQTINETDIASFELEAGESKKDLASIKKLEPGNAAHPANIYQVAWSGSVISSEKMYFRIKVNFSNGKTVYTDAAIVKMRKAK